MTKSDDNIDNVLEMLSDRSGMMAFGEAVVSRLERKREMIDRGGNEMTLQEAAEIVIGLTGAGWIIQENLSDTEKEAVDRVKTHFASIAKVEEEMERMDAIMGTGKNKREDK